MNNARILIVEDEVFTADQEEKRLTELGYEVVGKVATGKEAIHLARETNPDLVLMDIKLRGEMDGIATAEVLKEELGIAVIYVTAFSDEDLLSRAKLTEPFGYILKPFDGQELKSNIEMALYKRKAEEDVKKALDESERLNKLLLQREFRIKELSDKVKKLESEKKGE